MAMRVAAGRHSSTTTTTATTSTGTGGSGPCAAVDPSNACGVCAQAACPLETMACCEAEGCIEVFDCEIATGCDIADPLGPGGCYGDSTCKSQIDVAGLDVAQGQAVALYDCAQAKCPAECETGGGG